MEGLGLVPEPTPIRHRSRRTTGFAWGPPEQAPGGVLPADVQRRQQEKLRAIDAAQGRARVSAQHYVVYR